MIALLAKEELDELADKYESVPDSAAQVLCVAALHRVMSVYQVCSQVNSQVAGFNPAYSAVIGAWRLLRCRPGANVPGLRRLVDAALPGVTSDGNGSVHGTGGETDRYMEPMSVLFERVMKFAVGEAARPSFAEFMIALDVYNELVESNDLTFIELASSRWMYECVMVDIIALLESNASSVESISSIFRRVEREAGVVLEIAGSVLH